MSDLIPGQKVFVKRNIHGHVYDKETKQTLGAELPFEKEAVFVKMRNGRAVCRYKTPVGPTEYSFDLVKVRVP
jgi:hypothetical protein